MDSGDVLDFYFDYISHNAYLAWMRIHSIAERHGLRVRPMPVLFAAMLDAYGQVGPAELPPKRDWMLRNVLRKAAAAGIPLNPPATHPFNPLLALRVSSLDMAEDLRRELIDRLFRAVWADRLEVSDPAVVRELCHEIGLGSRDLLSEASATEAKDRVRRQTDDALSCGVFGVPSMVVRGELFWGYDDFPQLEQFLAGRNPLPPDYRSDWERIKPSAMRRRKP
jgi:2-hydroxychromene-2-carboxylate isomerase